MSSNNELVDIDGELIPPYETEKAYYFYDGSTKCWLPRSLVEWDDKGEAMTMPYWLAEREGLI